MFFFQKCAIHQKSISSVEQSVRFKDRRSRYTVFIRLQAEAYKVFFLSFHAAYNQGRLTFTYIFALSKGLGDA